MAKRTQLIFVVPLLRVNSLAKQLWIFHIAGTSQLDLHCCGTGAANCQHNGDYGFTANGRIYLIRMAVVLVRSTTGAFGSKLISPSAATGSIWGSDELWK